MDVFYEARRIMNIHQKAYYIKTSWCKMCVSEDNRERNRGKQIKK